jgi:homoserine trans-succinylase
MNLEKNKLIRLEEVTLNLAESEDILKSKIAGILLLPEKSILEFKILKILKNGIFVIELEFMSRLCIRKKLFLKR